MTATTEWRGSVDATRRARRGATVVFAIFVAMALGLAAFAVLVPVTADVFRPAPVGEEWAGVPPDVSVDCGTFLQSKTPTWPADIEPARIGDSDRSRAAHACDEARTNRQWMLVGAAVLALIGALILAWERRAERRST